MVVTGKLRFVYDFYATFLPAVRQLWSFHCSSAYDKCEKRIMTIFVASFAITFMISSELKGTESNASCLELMTTISSRMSLKVSYPKCITVCLI